MVNLLKTFGKGILYVIGLPFFIVALVIFGAIGLIAFVFQLIKSIFFFFTGQKFFPELPEDKELRLKMEQANNPYPNMNKETEEALYQEEPVFEEEPLVRNEKVEPEYTTTPIEEACFKDETIAPSFEEEEVEIEETPVESIQPEETFDDPMDNIEEKTLQTSEPEEEPEEELETYVPNRSSYKEVEDDTNDNGVKIDYDL